MARGLIAQAEATVSVPLAARKTTRRICPQDILLDGLHRNRNQLGTNHMKLFAAKEIRQAVAYAQTGETAIHLHCIVFPNSPTCFKSAVIRGEWIAHVFSQDAELLKEIARRSGIRVICLEHEGSPRQHIDFCGRALRNLLLEAGYTQADMLRQPVPSARSPW